jgi:hypothetical protein
MAVHYVTKNNVETVSVNGLKHKFDKARGVIVVTVGEKNKFRICGVDADLA